MNDAMAPTRAFDRTLPPSEALGRIRDAYHDYDHEGGALGPFG
jgi:hypothetical protein